MAHIEDNKLIILDKKYIKAPEIHKSKSRLSPLIQSIMMLSSIYYNALYNTTVKKKEHPNVDIISEYELILQKKSKLSKSKRDWVVYEFKKHFIEVE